MKRGIQENNQTQGISQIIHELNQPITVIKAYLGGCELRLERQNLKSEELRHTFIKMNEHIELLCHKIDKLNDLSYKNILFSEPNPMAHLLNEIISLYAYEIDYHAIQICFNFHENLSHSQLSDSPVKQVLFRLIKLCIHSIEINKIQNSEIAIQTRSHESVGKIIIKTNFVIQEEYIEKEMNYCRSLLNKNRNDLLAELSANNKDCQFIVFLEGNGYA